MINVDELVARARARADAIIERVRRGVTDPLADITADTIDLQRRKRGPAWPMRWHATVGVAVGSGGALAITEGWGHTAREALEAAVRAPRERR